MGTSTPPSVLFVVPDLFGPPGGIARYCRMVASALTELGVSLSVIALHDQGEQIPDREYTYFACKGSRSRFIRTTLAEFLRVKPKLVIVGHCHLAPVIAIPCLVTATPYFVALHGIEVWQRLSAMRRWVLQNATHLLAVSQYTISRTIREQHIQPGLFSLLYNCLDPQFTAPDINMSGEALSILTVTRLSRADSYKGVDIVLRALPLILEKYPQVQYHIVGDGDARSDLQELATTLGVREMVNFHGRVSDETLREMYAQTTVFLMPSRAEGFGFVFLEAMSQGTPAIGGNEDATPEVIIDGETGYTVDPTSEAAVAEATLHLLQNPDLRTRMSKAAHDRAYNVFSYAQFRKQLWEYVTPYLSKT